MTYKVDKLFKPKRKIDYNLSKEEMQALKWFSTNRNLVIKADEGGTRAVWGRGQYITEAVRQPDV